MAQYSSESKLKFTRYIHLMFIGGSIAAILYLILEFMDLSEGFFGGLCLGIQFGMLLVGAIITSKNAAKIRCAKLRFFKKLGLRKQ